MFQIKEDVFEEDIFVVVDRRFVLFYVEFGID